METTTSVNNIQYADDNVVCVCNMTITCNPLCMPFVLLMEALFCQLMSTNKGLVLTFFVLSSALSMT